jgi:hypothetical protein
VKHQAIYAYFAYKEHYNMSPSPNQAGVARLLRLLNNSYLLARQDENNDEVIRIAPLLLTAFPRQLMQAKINSVEIFSTVDRTMPRQLFGQTTYLQSDPSKATSFAAGGFKGWLDEEVQPYRTRRSLLVTANAFIDDGSYNFDVVNMPPLIRSIRRFADEIFRTQTIKDFASNADN